MQLDVKRNRNKVTPSDVKYALTSELLWTNEKNSLSISGQTMLARENIAVYHLGQLQKYICGNFVELKQVYSATLKYNSKPEII